MRTILAILLVVAAAEAVIIADLFQQNKDLEEELKKLEIDLKVYEKSNERVLAKNEELWNNLTRIKKENDELRMKIQMLESENRQLKEKVNELNSELKSLRNLVEELKKVPKGHYSTDFFRDRVSSVAELKNFLKTEFFLPHGYSEGVFDCSEIAAYTEWALEDAGFDAYIVQGYYSVNGVTRGHAWVMVEVAGTTYYVDPTVMRKSDDRTLLILPEKYRIRPTAVFENIYEAIEHDGSAEEWDWWSVTGFPPKIKS